IQRYMGKFFVDGQRLGMVRKDVPTRLIIEILLAMVQSIMNPPKMEELGMVPKEGYAGILKIVLEGALTPKGQRHAGMVREALPRVTRPGGSSGTPPFVGWLRHSKECCFRNDRSGRSPCGPAVRRSRGENPGMGRGSLARRSGDRAIGCVRAASAA